MKVFGFYWRYDKDKNFERISPLELDRVCEVYSEIE